MGQLSHIRKIKKLNHEEVEIIDGGDCARFKREKGGKTVYDIFFENIHVHVSVSEAERIYSIRVKRPEQTWVVPFCDTSDLPPDFGRPTNEYYEVYVWYNVPVLDITKAEGYVYKHGSWDKYVYKKMLNFFDDAKKETHASKFNDYYK